MVEPDDHEAEGAMLYQHPGNTAKRPSEAAVTVALCTYIGVDPQYLKKSPTYKEMAKDMRGALAAAYQVDRL